MILRFEIYIRFGLRVGTEGVDSDKRLNIFFKDALISKYLATKDSYHLHGPGVLIVLELSESHNIKALLHC